MKCRSNKGEDNTRILLYSALEDCPQTKYIDRHLKVCEDGTLTQEICFWTLFIVLSLTKNRPVYI
jgi:hypothetical protein